VKVVQDAGPGTDAGGGQQILHAWGAGEATHRLPGQAELAHDGLDGLALGAQGLDLLVALPGALGQPVVLGLLRGWLAEVWSRSDAGNGGGGAVEQAGSVRHRW
jgi:hypothetical protein